MTRLLFIVTGLGIGGAENALLAVLQNLDRARFEPHVYVLTDKLDVAPRIRALGVPVMSFGITSAFGTLGGMLRLNAAIRRLRPDVVQTWMYHADLLGSLAARLAGVRHIAWSLHNSNLSPTSSPRGTRAVARACARLSRSMPTAILSCSKRARDIHVELGYDAAKFRIIPNGFDTTAFQPDAATRARVRAELGIPEDAPVLIMLGRFHAQKNQQGLLRAARRVLDSRPNARFLLAGTDVTMENKALSYLVHSLGLERHVRLLGYRADTAQLLRAADALVLPSLFGEAFPLVVGEAMATGLPCIVSDVGDSAYMVDDSGTVVTPGDDNALVEAMIGMVDMSVDDRARRGARARRRVGELFDIRKVVAQYENFYQSMKRV